MDHANCAQKSQEEAQEIERIYQSLLKQSWIDRDGVKRRLTPENILEPISKSNRGHSDDDLIGQSQKAYHNIPKKTAVSSCLKFQQKIGSLIDNRFRDRF